MNAFNLSKWRFAGLSALLLVCTSVHAGLSLNGLPDNGVGLQGIGHQGTDLQSAEKQETGTPGRRDQDESQNGVVFDFGAVRVDSIHLPDNEIK